MSKKATKKQLAEALENLRSWIKPGDTVYTILRSHAKSGMSRRIGMVLIDNEKELRFPDYAVSVVVCGRTLEANDPEGIRVDGCGFDAGFDLVYSLGIHLFPEGYQCLGENCRSTEHQGEYGYPNEEKNGRDWEKREWIPGPPRDGKMTHKDAGYALQQRWI